MASPTGAGTGATGRRYWSVSPERSQSEFADFWREVSQRAARGLRRWRGEFGLRFRRLGASGRGECGSWTSDRSAPAQLGFPAQPDRNASPALPLLSPVRVAEPCRPTGNLGESRDDSLRQLGPGRWRAVAGSPKTLGPSRPSAQCVVTGWAQPRPLPLPLFSSKLRTVLWPSTVVKRASVF